MKIWYNMTFTQYRYTKLSTASAMSKGRYWKINTVPNVASKSNLQYGGITDDITDNNTLLKS